MGDALSPHFQYFGPSACSFLHGVIWRSAALGSMCRPSYRVYLLWRGFYPQIVRDVALSCIWVSMPILVRVFFCEVIYLMLSMMFPDASRVGLNVMSCSKFFMTGNRDKK